MQQASLLQWGGLPGRGVRETWLLSSTTPLVGFASLKALFHRPMSQFLTYELSSVGTALERLLPIPCPVSHRPRAW